NAGELAATYGIKVYAIMAGTGTVIGPGPAHQPSDTSDLQFIAKVTGGEFYQARDPGSLRKIYHDIDQLERTKTEERRFVRWSELATPWLLAAFICAGFSMLL